KKELTYLAGLVSTENQSRLFLPIIIQVGPGMDRIEVVCQSEIEVRLISDIIGMAVAAENYHIVIFAPQLAALRRQLKTTTQYVFSLKMPK
ncbi:MAG: DUF61 family protein, partial [Dehalococcoidales bacterium]|nr:DUF61 family protein [Dehalococcoidales bacterium]